MTAIDYLALYYSDQYNNRNIEKGCQYDCPKMMLLVYCTILGKGRKPGALSGWRRDQGSCPG